MVIWKKRKSSVKEMSTDRDWSRKRSRETDESGKSVEGHSDDVASPPQAGNTAARSDPSKTAATPGSQHPLPRQHSSSGNPLSTHPTSRLPPGPSGYYPSMYPPHAPHQGPVEGTGYPPPRGYDNIPPPGYPGGPHPYAVAPHYPYMPYGLYPPPYPPHPMYGHPPPHPQSSHHGQPLPPYGYAPLHHDPNLARYPESGSHEATGGYPPHYGPILSTSGMPPTRTGGTGQHQEGDRKRSASRASVDSSRSDGTDDDLEEDESGNIVPGAVTARLKTYIKPRIPSTQDVLDRRARKNAQSRARAAKLRERIAEIELKPAEERTEEEVHLWAQYEQRRQRKNNRSRERALEKKEEIDRIVAKMDKKRSKIEKQFLETALSAKKRKNEGDRLRRQRLKELGLSTKGTGVKPGISARGPLPPQYQHLQQSYGQAHHGNTSHHGGGEIPMSPLPAHPHHHSHHFQSPGFGSPGMMPNLSFPSPSHNVPGRHHMSMSYMPVHGYDSQISSPSQGRRHRQQSHDPQASGSQVVEQRRHPDGSITFSIDGRGTSSNVSGRGGIQNRQPVIGGDQQVGMNELLLDNDAYGDIDEENASGDEPDVVVKTE